MNLELCSWQSPSYLALSTGSWRLPKEPRRRRGIPPDSKTSGFLVTLPPASLLLPPLVDPMIPSQTIFLALGDCSCMRKKHTHGCIEDFGLPNSRLVCMSRPLIQWIRRTNFGLFYGAFFNQSLICWWSCRWVASFHTNCSRECFHIDSI